MKKGQKLSLGMVVGTAISAMTLVALGIICVLAFMYGGPAEVTTDASKYSETIIQYGAMRTALITFPEELPESARGVDFYFSYKDTWNSPACEVFLQCTYDEADYQAEVERLENTKKRYSSIQTLLRRDEEERFAYPVYIAVDGRSEAYEYALLSGEKQITYIYTSHKKQKDLHKIESKYLPADFDSRQASTRDGEGYSIYLIQEESIDRKQGAQYDFTRDDLSEGLEFHPLAIGYNRFTVCTRLDENNQEVIRYCAYVYYEDEHDSIYGYPDEIPYEELAGYQFTSVELNENETIAIVTYYDGDEEKTWEYEIPKM